MTRPTLLAIILVGVAQVAFAQDLPKKADYYPLAVGAKWIYKVAAGDAAQEHTMTVTKIETSGGQTVARIDNTVAGKRGGADVIAVSDKGVFRRGPPPVAFNPPICLLKYPVQVGDSWNDTVKVGSETVKASHRVASLDEVETPAGKFKAVKVIGVTETGGQKVETTYWFADGVGVVKQTVALSKAEIKFELQKFEKGK